jgi:glycosyltransferase involved in cell wall biosynthesis
MTSGRYVLITPARNEEANIEKTIRSVMAQSVQPQRWVVVSDGSTDRTDEIVSRYAARYKVLQLIRLPDDGGTRNFARQVNATNIGYAAVRRLNCGFVGILDGDVSFETRYYERLLEELYRNPRLGITGGVILENRDGRNQPRLWNSAGCVAGAIQLFRRSCYEAIGGYIALECGGQDAIAIAMARMKGWAVESFADLPVLHHRPTGTAVASVWRAKIREGRAEYLRGYHPVFHALKCLRRMREKPYALASVLRLCGYWSAFMRRESAPVPEEVVQYIRCDQRRRMWSIINPDQRDDERYAA